MTAPASFTSSRQAVDGRALRPLLLGHRGARGVSGVVENTLPAFETALNHGCDGFELDVRVSADGIALIHHDPRLGNSTISRTPRVRLLSIASLDEVLCRYSKRAFIDIEVKAPGAETSVLDALRKHPPKRGYVISSFHPAILMDFASRKAALPLGLICDKRTQLAGWNALPIEYLIVKSPLADEELIHTVHRKRKRIFVWTVNEPSAMIRFADLEVDGIISDDPHLLVQTLWDYT